jgi:hypothetical protein
MRKSPIDITPPRLRVQMADLRPGAALHAVDLILPLPLLQAGVLRLWPSRFRWGDDTLSIAFQGPALNAGTAVARSAPLLLNLTNRWCASLDPPVCLGLAAADNDEDRWCFCACVCVCVRAHVYVCVRARTCARTHTHAQKCMCMYVCVRERDSACLLVTSLFVTSLFVTSLCACLLVTSLFCRA